MGLATIILLAAAADPAAVEPTDWRLKARPAPELITPGRCREGGARGDIVVCGRRPKEFLPGTPEGAEEFESDGPGRIVRDIGIGTLSPELEQVEMPDGQISKRILVRFRMPF